MPLRRPLLLTAALTVAGFLGACGAEDGPGRDAARAPSARAAEYALPGDRVFPEGIAVEASTGRVFVGSTADGTVFRGGLPGRALEVLLPGGRDGRTAVTGLEVDRRGRLFVAGRDTALAFVYDAGTGRRLRTLRVSGRGRSLLNDIAVTEDAAYFTDSYRPTLYRARLDGAQVGELEPWLDLARTPIPTRSAFGLNGVVATADGRHLLTVHFDTGRLFRIDTRTRAVREVDVGGASLRTGDGMVLDGLTLLVVREEPGDVLPLRLERDLLGARAGTPFGGDALALPTTAAIRGTRLLVVNSQLDRTAGQARLPFTVSVLRRP